MWDCEHYNEDFCADDLDGVNDLDDLERMEADIEGTMCYNEEQNVYLKDNLKIIQDKIKEIKNE